MTTKLLEKSRLNLKVLPSKRAQGAFGGLLYLLIAIILVVAVVEPITISVVSGLNVTGANKTTITLVLDLIPVLVAVLALVVVVRAMGIF